ncbi:MAG TPA: hypothetical protein PKB07_18520 [Flavilitoribacter sp.]|nr:hypothetical protein [Flavilitoribacter sp.]
MLKPILTAVILLRISFLLSAQSSKVVIEGGMPIDDKRYADIKENPYFFDDWVVGTVIISSLDKFEDVQVNYNGYTRNFEVKNGDKYIELDERIHKRVEIYAEKNPGRFKDNTADTLVFMSGFHPKFADHYALIVYAGKNFVYLKDFSTGISEKTMQDVGRTINIKRFTSKEDLYFLLNGDLIPVKLKKKAILDALPKTYRSKAEEYMAANKSKLNSDEELIGLLRFLE